MKKYILLLFFIILFSSCKQAETLPADSFSLCFENPQPINDSELNSIPNKFLGVYMNSDSIFLKIQENIIFLESHNKFRIHEKYLDSLKDGFKIINDKFYLKDNDKTFESKKIGDSIELTEKFIDTIFIFSKSNKAKRISGNLVLNQKDSIYWKVKLISLNKNSLKIKQLYSDSDLKRLDSITKFHSKMIDSTSFLIKPSRGEFKKIVKLKNLGFDQIYDKISN
jgi:PBP1b-binding outer membrane lipoprotein LpoB